MGAFQAIGIGSYLSPLAPGVFVFGFLADASGPYLFPLFRAVWIFASLLKIYRLVSTGLEWVSLRPFSFVSTIIISPRA
jgi:hypothetical protein